MGRERKPCDQTCPKCKKSCRFKIKRTRGNKKARYIERTYALHRDGTECYIDNFVKAKDAPSNIVAKFAHTLSLVGEQMKKFPLTDLETRQLNVALRTFMLNFTEPQRSVLRRQRAVALFDLREMSLPSDTNQGWSELVEDFRKLEKDPNKLDELRLKWCTIQDISDTDWTRRTDTLLKQMRILYNKYENSKRVLKRKIINQKISETYWKPDRLYEGKPTNDYRGTESILPT